MGAQGTTTIDFGAFPGSAMATKVITSEAGIASGSLVEAWLRPQSASADHNVDEHRAVHAEVRAHTIVAGTGFSIDMIALFGQEYGVWNLSWVWN